MQNLKLLGDLECGTAPTSQPAKGIIDKLDFAKLKTSARRKAMLRESEDKPQTRRKSLRNMSD